jgi:hypothetical protein
MQESSYKMLENLFIFYLKHHASKFRLIMKILKLYLKVKYFEVNKNEQRKEFYSMQTTLSIHVNFQINVKICKKRLLTVLVKQ